MTFNRALFKMAEHESLIVVPSANPVPNIESGSNAEIKCQYKNVSDETLVDVDSRLCLLVGADLDEMSTRPRLEEEGFKPVFQKIVNDLSNPQLGNADTLSQYETVEMFLAATELEEPGNEEIQPPEHPVAESEYMEPIPEYLDTLRSGESLVKYYNFNKSKNTKDTEKCVAFWEAITQAGIEPANCPKIKFDEAKSSKSVNSECESEEAFYVWYHILQNLQTRKLDEVAFAASGKKCKFCTREASYFEFKKKQNPKYSEDELRDDGDLTYLNNWQSVPVPRRERPPSATAKEKSAERNSSALTYRPFSRNQLKQERPKIRERCPCKNDECHCISIDPSGGPVCTILQMEEILEYPQDLTRSKLPYKILQKTVQKMAFNNIEKSFQLSDYDMKTPFYKKLNCLRTTIDQSNDKKELPIMSKCAICNKMFCLCEGHLEKKAEQFVDQLQYELKNISKDKLCITDKEEDNVSKIKQLCGHNNCRCRETSPKIQKYFQFIQLAHENEQSNVSDEKLESKLNVPTEAKRISTYPPQKMLLGHIKDDVCYKDQRIDSDTTLPDVSEKSEHIVKITSQLPKILTVAPTLLNKAIKNKDLMPAESNTKCNEKLNVDSETTKKCQKPMLWYCSDMPKRKGDTSDRKL